MSQGNARRVLLACYSCAPGQGTEPGAGWHTALSLVQVDPRLEVHVLTWTGNRAAIEAARPGLGEPGTRLEFDYVGLPGPLGRLRESSVPNYMLWQGAAYLRARRLALRWRPDVVHHLTFGSLMGGTWLWRLGRPLVYGPAGGGQVSPPQARPYFGQHWRRERVRTALTRVVLASPAHRRLARHISLALATNRSTGALFTRLGVRQVRLMLDSGLPNDMVAPALPDRTRPDGAPLRVLWVGRLVPLKALQLALEALATVEVPWTLTVIAGGPQRAESEGWAEALGVRDRVTFTGRVPWAEVQRAYATHDLFLFSSMRDSFGSQLLEAAAQGLPVVCLNHHGAGDMLPADVALRVPLSGPESLPQRLGQAITTFAAMDRAARDRMGEAALAFARGQVWPRRAELLLRLYAQVLAEETPQR